MPTKTKQRANTTPKRHEHQRKKTKAYRKAYWPYLPMLLIVLCGFLLNIKLNQSNHNGVLAYATEISSHKLLSSTNEQRQRYGAGQLKINDNLSRAAQAKANDMAKRDYWSHTTPDGTQPWKFVQDSGYGYQKAGENLAYGFDSSKDTVTGWMNSPTHKENMLDRAYTEVGFGYANVSNFNKSGPETIVVAMYGQPLSSSTANLAPSDSKSGFSSANNRIVEPATLSVSRIESLTGGVTPWLTFGIGIIIGSALFWVAYKHGRAVKKAAVQGEEFILHNPVFDIVVVAIATAGWLLIQTSGVIK